MNRGDATGPIAAAQPAQTPLVSILMPVYRARYLRAAIESALGQTHTHLEVVICDDDRTGEVETLVAAFTRRDARVRYQRNPVTLGTIPNAQRCFDLASGDYCLYLCDDDLLVPFCVERLAAALQAEPGVTMAYGHVQSIDGDDRYLPDPPWARRRFPVDARVQGTSLAATILGVPLNTVGSLTGVLFRRGVLASVSSAIQAFGGHLNGCNNDVGVWLNLLTRGDAVCLTSTLSYWRVHAGQGTNRPEVPILGADDWRSNRQTARAMGILTDRRPDLVWRPLAATGQASPADLDFTGERQVPGKTTPQVELEHVTRYRYAAQLVGAGRVLDDGCGAGYGSAILAEGGATVTGIDVDPLAITHCRQRYPHPRLDFQTMDSTHLTFPDESFDAVVSFEVIEHTTAYREYALEAYRVLRPDGLFIVSTPNKRVCTDEADHHNPWHLHEFYLDDFRQLLEDIFPSVQLVGQTFTQSLVIGLPPAGGVGGLPPAGGVGGLPPAGGVAPFTAHWPEVDGLVVPSAEGYLNKSRYLIALCRKTAPAGFALPALPGQVTVLAADHADTDIRLVSGFHQDQGGRRWMGPEGIITVPAALLASPARLRFALACGLPGHYAAFPFQVQVYANDVLRGAVTFDQGEQARTVSLDLAPGAGARIRLVSGQTFTPSLLGISADPRAASVRLVGLTLDRPTGETPPGQAPASTPEGVSTPRGAGAGEGVPK